MSPDIQMHFDPGGSLLASARDCEAEVFLKWFGNTAEQIDREYSPYEDSSAFLVLADGDEPVVEGQ